MMNSLQVRSIWLLASVSCLSLGCQETEFTSGSTGSVNSVTVASVGTQTVVSTATEFQNDNVIGIPPQAKSNHDSGLAHAGPESDLNEGGDEAITQEFRGTAITDKRVVDVVFAVDTSGSMSEEKQTLEMNMAKFMETLATQAKLLDFRVFFIGQNFVFPAGNEKITKIDYAVGSRDALLILQSFFAGVIPTPVALRPEALKEIVVVTDDNAQGDGGAAFKNFINTNPLLAGKTRLNGFVGLPTSIQSATCQLANFGQDYITLSMDPELGGLVQDICLPDWSKLLKNLADRIILSVPSAIFTLEQAADPNQKIIIAVDGKEVEKGTAKYDPEFNSIVFAPGHEPPAGAVVSVTFTPLPE